MPEKEGQLVLKNVKVAQNLCRMGGLNSATFITNTTTTTRLILVPFAEAAQPLVSEHSSLSCLYNRNLPPSPPKKTFELTVVMTATWYCDNNQSHLNMGARKDNSSISRASVACGKIEPVLQRVQRNDTNWIILSPPKLITTEYFSLVWLLVGGDVSVTH